MTRREANRILDRVRSGSNIPKDHEIAAALQATGDMGEVPEYPVVRFTPSGEWEIGVRGRRPAQWHEVLL